MVESRHMNRFEIRFLVAEKHVLIDFFLDRCWGAGAPTERARVRGEASGASLPSPVELMSDLFSIRSLLVCWRIQCDTVQHRINR